MRPLKDDEDVILIPDRYLSIPETPKTDHLFWKGYSRYHQGKLVGAGIKNKVMVLNTVKCSETASINIAHLIRMQFADQFKNVDDVVACTHDFGCGMPTGDAKRELVKLLVRAMNHPNIGAIILIGLGCEHLSLNEALPGNIVGVLREDVYDFERRVFLSSIQSYTSEYEALKSIAEIQGKKAMQVANESAREELPLRYLTLGLKCGGSDRFSGVSANAVLGTLSDLIIENGGRVIITETPEFEGSMELLAARATSLEIPECLLDLIPKIDRLCGNYPISASGYQDIAPGNKGGGLHNARLKSAGALKKCGSKPVVGYLEYGESLPIDSPNGVYVLDCPSYDQISTTVLLLSGAQTVAFTTGLGTTISSAISPVLKIGNRKKMGLNEHVDLYSKEVLFGKRIEEIAQSWLMELLQLL